MDSTAFSDNMKGILETMDSQTNAFCLNDLSPGYLSELLLHLNIVVPKDMDPEKMKETLLLSSIYMEKFKTYSLSDVAVFFNKDVQVVNLVTIDKKVALYELDCEYPCCLCHFNVDDDGHQGQGLQCSVCEAWFHNTCTETPLADDFYNSLTDSPEFIKVCCPPCLKNGQVKKLYNQLVQIGSDVKEEILDVKQLINNFNHEAHIRCGYDADQLSTQSEIVANLRLEVKNILESEMVGFKTDLQAVISDKIDTQIIDVSSIKAEVSSINKVMNELQIFNNDEVKNSNITALQMSISEMENSLNALNKKICKSNDTIADVSDLNKSLNSAVESLVNLEKSFVTSSGSYEEALDHVVSQVNNLNSIDITELASSLNHSAEIAISKINKEILKPATLNQIANKVAEAIPTKTIQTNELDTPSTCSGECVTKIEAKLNDIIGSTCPDNCDESRTTSSALESSSSQSSASSWTTMASKKARTIKNGTVTHSAKKSQSDPNAASAFRNKLTNNDMDAKKTITIGNVNDASISNSARIKSAFNKCFPRMEIVHCKRAINGFILVEVDTVENAKRVVSAWDGSKFFKTVEGQDTFAHILEDARAKAILEDVDKELTDDFITQETQKLFPNASAKRFKNKFGPTHVVLLTFASKTDLEKASQERLLIGDTIYRTKPYEVKRKLTQCYKCFSFNHIARNCVKERVCPFCCGRHEERQCEIKKNNETEKYVCVNCRGNHSALSKECDVYKKFDHMKSNNHD